MEISEHERGMMASTRCKFCGSFYDKAVSFVCPICWEMVQEYVEAAVHRALGEIERAELVNPHDMDEIRNHFKKAGYQRSVSL